MVLLKYDGYAPANSPTTYDLSYENIVGDDSFISESGYEVYNMVRAGVVTIGVAYSNLPTSELSALKAKLIQETIVVTYFDGATKSSTFKANNPKIQMVSLVDGGYWNLSFELREL